MLCDYYLFYVLFLACWRLLSKLRAGYLWHKTFFVFVPCIEGFWLMRSQCLSFTSQLDSTRYCCHYWSTRDVKNLTILLYWASTPGVCSKRLMRFHTRLLLGLAWIKPLCFVPITRRKKERPLKSTPELTSIISIVSKSWLLYFTTIGDTSARYFCC